MHSACAGAALACSPRCPSRGAALFGSRARDSSILYIILWPTRSRIAHALCIRQLVMDAKSLFANI